MRPPPAPVNRCDGSARRRHGYLIGACGSMAGNVSSAPWPWRCCRRDRLTLGAVIAAAAIWTIAVFFSAPTLAATPAGAATLVTGVISLSLGVYAGGGGPRWHGRSAPGLFPLCE